MQINLKIELLKMYHFLIFLFVPMLLTRIKCYLRGKNLYRCNIHFKSNKSVFLLVSYHVQVYRLNTARLDFQCKNLNAVNILLYIGIYLYVYICIYRYNISYCLKFLKVKVILFHCVHSIVNMPDIHSLFHIIV